MIRVIALAACFGVALAGCRASGIAQLPASPPSDFALAITVLAPTTAAASPADRPARYIVEPDRNLRVAIGPGAVESTLPPITRLLDRSDYDAIWVLFVEAELSDEARISTGATYEPPTGDAVAVVTAGYLGRRHAWAVPIEHARPMIDRLGKLGWVSD